MKKLTIGGKEYTIEFTIEASLFDECTEKLTSLAMSIGESMDGNDAKRIISTLSGIPQTALTMFYAGLLEHHGKDVGDGSITSKKDAKLLARQYFDEHKEDGQGNFYALLEMLIECMNGDGFFRQIGLEQMLKEAKKEEASPKKRKASES